MDFRRSSTLSTENVQNKAFIVGITTLIVQESLQIPIIWSAPCGLLYPKINGQTHLGWQVLKKLSKKLFHLLYHCLPFILPLSSIYGSKIGCIFGNCSILYMPGFRIQKICVYIYITSIWIYLNLSIYLSTYLSLSLSLSLSHSLSIYIYICILRHTHLPSIFIFPIPADPDKKKIVLATSLHPGKSMATQMVSWWHPERKHPPKRGAPTGPNGSDSPPSLKKNTKIPKSLGKWPKSLRESKKIAQKSWKKHVFLTTRGGCQIAPRWIKMIKMIVAQFKPSIRRF